MKDLREEFISKTRTNLLDANYDPTSVGFMLDIMSIVLNDYDLSLRTTDLVTIHGTSEELFKIYAGCLLTEGKRPKTVKLYVQVLRRFADEIDVSVIDATTFTIRVWLAKKQQTVSLRTCENYRSYLASFYTWLTNEGIIDINPMCKIKPVKYPEKIKPAFSDVEVDSMKCACADIRDRALLEFLLASGVRISEACNMNRSDVNMSTLEVIVNDGKGGKSRKTYITDVCAEYLRKYLDSRKDSDEWLFGTRNKSRISRNAAEMCLRRIGELSGVTNVHPHRCRRTFATNLFKKGMDVRTIQLLMGHSDINTTMEYIAVDSSHTLTEFKKYS